MKRKITITALMSLLIFGTVACDKNEKTPQNSGVSQNQSTNSQSVNSNKTNEKSKTLIVYFSMPETDKPGNMTEDEENSTVVINGKVLGNTQYMAETIQKTTGGDIFRIIPKVPYTTDHKKLVEKATEERKGQARPEISGTLPDVSGYDTIFIGYPIWWSDMPMIMYTFLDSVDLSGKTVIPFGTHGGSGFAGTVESIRELEPNARISPNGKTISRNSIGNAEKEIIDWVDEMGYRKE